MSIPATPANRQFRILIVEDDPNIARLIMTNLTKAGLECRYAADGIAGVEAFKQTDPHLVLTDIMMPGLNGSELCAKIRETSTVPIILMTAADSDDAQLQAFKVGADDYVSKPFNPKLMVARVVAHLRRVYRYDVDQEPAAEEKAPEPADMEAVPQRRTPPGWAECESCGYIGPRDRFEKNDSSGRRAAICPNCKQGENIAFAIG